MDIKLGNLDNVSVKSNSLESLCSSSTDGVPLSGHSSLSQTEENLLKTPVKNEPPSVQETSFSCDPVKLVSDSKLQLLWPQPQQMFQVDTNTLSLEKETEIYVFPSRKYSEVSIQEIIQAWKLYTEHFQKLNYSPTLVPSSAINDSKAKILCQINSAICERSESYRLTISLKELRIVANNLPGLHHGIRTLIQLLTLYKEDDGVPFLYIYDWPVIPLRAVLMNLSLDAVKTYTIETLKNIIDTFSRLKFNQLHLYVKFSARDGWQLPYSQIELLDIVEYCKARAISIVPTFDVASEFSIQDLIVTYPSIQQFLVTVNTYDYVHIGCNLQKMVCNSPFGSVESLWQYLPLDQDQAIFLSWTGIISDNYLVPFNVIPVHHHPQNFANKQPNPFTELQMGCCSATRVGVIANYCLTGCPKSTIIYIHKQLQQCSRYRNLAVIIGESKTGNAVDCTPLTFMLPGMLAAIGLTWNASIPEDYLEFQIHQLLNKYIVFDEEEITGQIIIELGRAEVYLHRDESCSGKSPLWQFLVDPDAVNLEDLTVDNFQKAMRHIKHCQQQLHRTRLCCSQSGELVAEIQLIVDLLLLACRIGRSLVTLGLNPNASCGVSVINAGVNNLPPTSRTDLANKLLGLTEQFRAIWLSRHLPSGLHAPLLLFTTLLQKLVPEGTNDA